MGFGPHKNADISLPLSTLVTIGIPAKKQVLFTFSNKAGTAESAFIIYRKKSPVGDLEVVHEAGSPPYRGWDDFRLTVSGDYLLTAWAKVDLWDRDLRDNDLYVRETAWRQSAVEQRPPTPPYFLRFVCDDRGNRALYYPDDSWNNGHDWSWDDVTGWASLIDL